MKNDGERPYVDNRGSGYVKSSMFKDVYSLKAHFELHYHLHVFIDFSDNLVGSAYQEYMCSWPN